MLQEYIRSYIYVLVQQPESLDVLYTPICVYTKRKAVLISVLEGKDKKNGVLSDTPVVFLFNRYFREGYEQIISVG